MTLTAGPPVGGPKPPIQARAAVMPGGILVPAQNVVTRPHIAPRPVKGTTMGSKTKAVDSDVSEFYFRIDLAIDPPLPDSKSKAAANDYFALKQKKDEDVQLVDGNIVVVSNNVTSIEQGSDPTDYTYGYEGFKKALVGVTKLAKDAGSEVNGQVVVRDASSQRFFRIKVDANNITVEAANLGWPDGTQTPMPENGGA